MNVPVDSNDERLQTLLRGARPGPALPPRFREEVWRRIERAEAPDALGFSRPFPGLERWIERLLRPRLVLASLAVLLVAGGVTGFVTSGHEARQEARARYLASVAPNPMR